MNQKVLVTGGAGFIGARLIEKLLDEGLEVHALDLLPLNKALRLQKVKDNRNLFYTKGDLRDKSNLINWYQSDATHLYHLASVVGVENYIKDPLSLIDIVVVGTRNLLELAAKYKTRVLFTSTSEVYGKNLNIPWSESDDRVLGPTSIDRWSYSSSKAVCEHMLFALYRSQGLIFTTVRFFNIYGPGQAPIFIISKSIYQALKNKAPLLYDSGKQTRCFTYVDDAIQGVLIASRHEKSIGQVFNIGSNIETTMHDAIDLIINQSSNKLEPVIFNTEKKYGELYEDIPRRIPSVSKAKEILNWEAKTSLQKGIELTVNWAKANSWWLE